jgi:hypothetical protein
MVKFGCIPWWDVDDTEDDKKSMDSEHYFVKSTTHPTQQ